MSFCTPRTDKHAEYFYNIPIAAKVTNFAIISHVHTQFLAIYTKLHNNLISWGDKLYSPVKRDPTSRKLAIPVYL